MTQSAEKEIDDIIHAGQVEPRVQGPVRPVLLLSVLSFVLLWLCFTPVELAPAAWIALTPFCVIVRTPSLSRRQYLVVTLCGWIWAVITLQWMRLGHPAMYAALVALGFYMSLYFPVFIGVSRRLIRSGIPLWITVPLVWTSLEFLRAWLMTGFAWYFLGHSQYRWIELVQIADVTGVYGITFLTAMSAAIISEFVSDSWFAKPQFETPRLLTDRQRLTAAATCLLLVGVSVAYGSTRKQSPDVTEGPVVALVQGHFPPEDKADANRANTIARVHDLLTRRAAELQPDLIVWPETMWPEPDWIEDPGLTDQQITKSMEAQGFASADRVLAWFRQGRRTKENLVNRSQEFGTAIVFGLVTIQATQNELLQYNSAAFVRPDLGFVGRYDKIHRVVFGEYTPLKSIFPFLVYLSPYGRFGLTAGNTPQVFESGGYHYAPAICFEDTVPRVIRRIVNHESDPAKRPDVLVNMTNDAWFRGSSQLDQHLITSIFRCIETRRPMVRAVNGGVSAFIDSSGRIRDPETFLLMTEDGFDGEFEQVDSMVNPETGRWYRECSGVLTGQVPLDGRSTIYLQYGDWFAMLCSAALIALLLRSFVKQKSVEAGSAS